METDISLSYLELLLCTLALLPGSWGHPDHCIAISLAHQSTTQRILNIVVVYIRHKNT